ncbi:adenylate-forming reductase 06235-like [Impatiens glandulifera]|uniref:adenylate-forming reductase 06235-like n=1 Tax=Impatiens glandulifera TaxID=253017 RepID=UPI001FB0A977|nr:adenylate-forming reductase 06235-like [Impatiens glandulifera]
MHSLEKVDKFTSCRGVTFEIKSHSNLFAITSPPFQADEKSRTGLKSWVPSFKVASNSIASLSQRSLSKPSSHFCDLDLDLDQDILDEDNDLGHVTIDVNLEEPIKREIAKESRLSIILLDQGLFTVYKRLFAVSFALNLIGLILAATGHFIYARERATLFSISNIFVLTMCRSEAFLRVVFWLVVKLFGHSCVPLRLKTAVTSLLQSLGGIHSGCGVSSIAWLVYAIILTINNREKTSTEAIIVASAILVLLCMSSLAAFPLLRHLHHNLFERTHRLAGWTALILLWLFIILTTSYDPLTKSYSDHIAQRLFNQPEFWLTLAVSITIIIPWITVRRVPVRVSSPSGHATLIKFDGGVKPGILGRISPSPLSEWHAFGIISDGINEHMMLAGAVGDFTKTLVSHPPSHLWVRKVHFAGLPYLTNMYDRVLLVATGSGICVFLSFLQNFGREIMEMVSGFPEERIIVHDTMVLGRPDVSKMSVEMAKKFRAEVVIVTSNPQGSRDVVNACKAHGIPAFGPIWDS